MENTHDLSKYHKEAVISTTGRSPFFTAVITFAEKECDMPLVSCNKGDEQLDLNIKFSDGHMENIVVERFNMEVKPE